MPMSVTWKKNLLRAATQIPRSNFHWKYKPIILNQRDYHCVKYARIREAASRILAYFMQCLGICESACFSKTRCMHQ